MRDPSDFDISKDKIYILLIKRGFLKEDLARCYMILYKNGATHARRVRLLLEKEFNIPKTTDTRILSKLRELVNLGFANETGNKITSSSPAPNFKAVKLETALKDVIDFVKKSEYKAHDDRLEEQGYYDEEKYTRWRKDTRSSVDSILNAISKSNKNILLSCHDGTWADEKSKEEILKSQKRGINIKFIISFNLPKTAEFFKWLKENKFDYIKSNDTMAPYCIIDNSIIFWGFKIRGLGDYRTMESDEKHVIDKFKSHFNSLFEKEG